MRRTCALTSATTRRLIHSRRRDLRRRRTGKQSSRRRARKPQPRKSLKLLLLQRRLAGPVGRLELQPGARPLPRWRRPRQRRSPKRTSQLDLVASLERKRTRRPLRTRTRTKKRKPTGTRTKRRSRARRKRRNHASETGLTTPADDEETTHIQRRTARRTAGTPHQTHRLECSTSSIDKELFRTLCNGLSHQ